MISTEGDLLVQESGRNYLSIVDDTGLAHFAITRPPNNLGSTRNMASAAPRSWLLKFNICSSLALAIVGIAAFLLFTILYGNYYAGVPGIFYSVINANLFFIFLRVERTIREDDRHKSYLKVSRVCGIVLFFASLSASVALFVLSAAIGVPVMPVQNSLVLAGIQSFIVTKSAATMVWYSRKYLAIMSGTLLTGIEDVMPAESPCQ